MTHDARSDLYRNARLFMWVLLTCLMALALLDRAINYAKWSAERHAASTDTCSVEGCTDEH